jgi:tetratricopeptide (TPR) repeat protein
MLSACGREEEALKEAITARDLDPLSLFANMGVAWAYHFAGRHEEAAREALKTREISPGFEEAGNVLVSSYEAMGRYRDAIAAIGSQKCWGVPMDAGELLKGFEEKGPRGYWEKRLQAIDAIAASAPPAIHFGYTVIYTVLEEPDRVLDHLEKMVDLHVAGSVFIAADRCLAKLRGNPRYDALVRRVGVPLAHTASTPHTALT